MKPLSIALLFAVLLASAALTRAAESQGSAPIVDAKNQGAVGSQTDAEANRREEEAMSADGFSAKERELILGKGERHEFQAEVSRMMDIIIHSLYKEREIFLRELISNAADALDKVRFLSLTDKSVLGEGDVADLDIRVAFNKEANTITITDKGIGMTKEELISNLGVVARSGTTEFLQKMANTNDNVALIGQFGVGFYSAYLVADKVTVVSKSNNSTQQYVWESEAGQNFVVAEDPRGNTLGRGTSIILHMREDAAEFLQQSRLEQVIMKHSQFINFPIYLHVSEEVEKEVPVEEDKVEDLDKKDKEAAEKDDDGEDADAEDNDKDEDKPKTKKVKETVWSWKRLNSAKAIWTRAPKEIEEQEYQDFYEALSKDKEGYLTKIHFVAEGEISFKSILYVPNKAEPGLYDKYYEKNSNLKLYVRRVLITDIFDDFLPRYLNFVRGVVDSDDLPLNVSRETLAQSKVLKVMAKKITRKVLELLKRLAEGGSESTDTEEGDEQAEGEDKVEKKEDKGDEKYMQFWNEYGKSIKLGLIDDRANRAKLSKLLRFQTSKSEGKFISLDKYVERMADNQEHIYYITGESLEAVRNAPFLERLNKRGLEVIYMTDPLDEYVAQSLTDYEGKDLMSVTKDDLKLPGEKSAEKYKEDFKDLAKWLKDTYGDKVEKVIVSSRLAESPAILVTGKYGWTANMERIMRAQTFADPSKQTHMVSKKTMEINPRHPIIVELKNKAAEDGSDPALKDLAFLLYDSALLSSGFNHDNPQQFAERIQRVMALGLDIDPSAKAEEEPLPVEAPADAEAGDAENSKDEL